MKRARERVQRGELSDLFGRAPPSWAPGTHGSRLTAGRTVCRYVGATARPQGPSAPAAAPWAASLFRFRRGFCHTVLRRRAASPDTRRRSVSRHRHRELRTEISPLSPEITRGYITVTPHITVVHLHGSWYIEHTIPHLFIPPDTSLPYSSYTFICTIIESYSRPGIALLGSPSLA